MEIVLHIGTEKTGTTSIQNFLSLHGELLNAKGVVPACSLPNLRFPANSSFLVTASTCTPGASLLRHRKTNFEEYRSDIKVRLSSALRTARESGVRKLVFSSEHLSSRLVTTADIEQLKQLFGTHHRLTIACYLRRQDELLLGAQAEGIKFGNPDLDLEMPNLRQNDEPYDRPYYDFEYMLGLWEQVFGKENLRVAAWEPCRFHDGNVIADFLKNVLGLTLTGELAQASARAAQNPENRRLSAQALFALSTLNSLPGADPRRNREVITQLDDDKSSALIEPERLSKFMARFVESNRRVAESYLGRDQLFSAKETAAPFFDFRKPSSQLEVLLRMLSKCLDSIPDRQQEQKLSATPRAP